VTILDRLLGELREAKGPISTSELAKRLAVSEPALDGMVSVLVAAGKLTTDTAGSGSAMACSGLACGKNCVGLEDCAFVVSVPQTHRLVIESPRAL
jgi:DNA-binding Lrp family transcriptional regulator